MSDDIHKLLAVLPETLRQQLSEHNLDTLIEIVIDLDRVPEARFTDKILELNYPEITESELFGISEQFTFGEDDRAGIEKTLHRISCIKNRQSKIVGLTMRVGKPIPGCAKLIEDLLITGKSILVVGAPGVGKTSILRDSARILSTTYSKRVVIIDSSNEIAGDSDSPHPAVGKSRRMQIPQGKNQAQIMIRGVENHYPQVIVIDEISNGPDVQAARTIAERGVQLIATAHGKTLQNIIDNPVLSDLIGGVQTVTLSDDLARKKDCRKSVMDRKHSPTFDIIVEILDFNQIQVHMDTSSAVDMLLSGEVAMPVVKTMEKGNIKSTLPEQNKRDVLNCYAKGIPKTRLLEASEEAGIPLSITNDLSDAEIAFVLYRDSETKKELKSRGIPYYVVKKSLDEAMSELESEYKA